MSESLRETNFTDELCEKIKSRIKVVNDCWEWQGSRNPQGYGSLYWQGKSYPAHRISYKAFVSDFADGLDTDHLCRNPPCVNPAHLEPVTRQVNVLRGKVREVNQARLLARTQCKSGHVYTEESVKYKIAPNGNPFRSCKQCERDSTMKWFNKNKRKTLKKAYYVSLRSDEDQGGGIVFGKTVAEARAQYHEFDLDPESWIDVQARRAKEYDGMDKIPKRELGLIQWRNGWQWYFMDYPDVDESTDEEFLTWYDSNFPELSPSTINNIEEDKRENRI